MEGIAGLHHTESYPDAELLPGLVVYRFDAPLIFANARMFSEAVREMAARIIQTSAGSSWRPSPFTDVDTTASDMLQELDAWLNARGVSLVFAEMKDPVRREDRAVRADSHDRPGALPPDTRRGCRGVQTADGSKLAPSERDMTTTVASGKPSPMGRGAVALALAALGSWRSQRSTGG